MDINITAFWAEFCPSDYSASQAEIGPNAGADTWRAACEDANDYPVLPDADAIDAFLGMVRSCGGWECEAIDAWDDDHVRALALQWLAGDMREAFQLPFGVRIDPASIDWASVRESNFYRADDGSVYWGVWE